MTSQEVRRIERERVLALLYQANVFDRSGTEILESLDSPESTYVKTRIEGIYAHIAEIDRVLTDNSYGWELSRMPLLDLLVMRFAVYELLYAQDLSAAVAISEAVELAKQYCSEQSPSFINGVLGGVLTSLAPRIQRSGSTTTQLS
ncbi:MAG: transcription antitermination factor NusB [Acidimicrobiales bacterium]